MAILDSLPADQRAVLQLVLQRGRTYDDIASLLSIDRAAVRQRALSALDAVGPQTAVPAERRALITDYLLGQLPPRVAESTQERLAKDPAERAWARVVASELSEIASEPLPEIPAASPEAIPTAEPAHTAPSPGARGRRDEQAHPEPVAARTEPAAAGTEPERPRRSSRRGGALLLGLGAILLAAAIVTIVLTSGGSSHKSTTAAGSTATGTPASGSTTSAGAATTTTPTGTTSKATQVVGQVNLSSPRARSKTAGIAEVLKQGTTHGVAIVAQNVPPNTKSDAYAIWLYNSPSDALRLGFVNPGVKSNGRLSTAGALPANASRFKQLIVTRETQANARQPGTIILRGPLPGLS